MPESAAPPGPIGLPSFYCFDNDPASPANTCGQAVIASLVRAYANEGVSAISDAALLSMVSERFGPNWPFKGGATNRGIMKRALRSFGIQFHESFAPLFSSVFTSSEKRARRSIEEWLRSERGPVVVLIAPHLAHLGGRFTLHWAVVYAYDQEAVRLATWGKSVRIPWADFMRAWRCWFAPSPYSFYHLRIEASNASAGQSQA
jgi:hypothetical protein